MRNDVIKKAQLDLQVGLFILYGIPSADSLYGRHMAGLSLHEILHFLMFYQAIPTFPVYTGPKAE